MPEMTSSLAQNVPALQMPPRQTAADGQPRRIGLEIEFAGVDLATAADILARRFGGSPTYEEAHRITVEGTRFGTFTVELDSEYAHGGQRSPADGDFGARLEAMARAAIGDVIEHWMPREIVTPPIPITEVQEIEELCQELVQNGAVGTGARPHYAFAMQLNPEVPSEACEDVLAIFRAFLLLSDWLHAVSGRDGLRHVVGFSEPFPLGYRRTVLDPSYAPEWGDFIDDYLSANPTRNRDLDLCPLFAHIDEARVRAHLSDPRIKARPTFHYRIPDSRIDDPDWSVTAEWNRWVLVERLADDRVALAERTDRFLNQFFDRPAADWIEDTTTWLEAIGPASA